MSNTAFAEFWERAIRRVIKEFPFTQERLQTLRFIKVERTDPGTPLAYDIFFHAIFYTKDFLKQVDRGTKGNDVKERIKLVHAGTHEVMHAGSFRKIVGDPNADIELHSGVQVNSITNNVKNLVRCAVNELLTNHFAHRVLQKNEKLASKPEYKQYRKDCEGDLIVANALIKHSSEKAILDAYFHGKISELEELFSHNGIDPRFLTMISSADPVKIAAGMAILGVSYHGLSPEALLRAQRQNFLIS